MAGARFRGGKSRVRLGLDRVPSFRGGGLSGGSADRAADRTLEMMKAGRYQLLDLLAEGGQAKVYRGLDDRGGGIKRLVAVKVVLGDLSGDPGLKRMFLEETRVSL